MKFFIIGLLIFITGCTNFNTGNYCGGFPTRPYLLYIEKDGTNAVTNYKKLISYVNGAEKFKKDCEYVN